jgi:NADH dehydrogenase (ubiquinone) 1 alpha subcomplex subunit 9
MPETAGKTYELGGPHVYSMLQCYETMFNVLEREPKIVYFPRKWAITLADKLLNWRFFNLEWVLQHNCDVVCKMENAGRIEDLYVRPVSFPQSLIHVLGEYRSRWPGKKADMER